MTDPTAQLATLRALRNAATDPAQRAALDAAIAALEAAMLSQSIGTVGQSRTPVERQHQMDVRDTAQVGAAISGDVLGDVQSGGTRYQALVQLIFTAGGVQPDDEQHELLASYLDHLARRCDRLRLAGVIDWERKRGKAPAFTLSQVYIALAATSWELVSEAEHEEAFADVLQACNPAKVLPQDARRVVPLHPELGSGFSRSGQELSLSRYALERPLLMTEALCRHRQLVLLGGPGSGKSTFLRHLALALAHAGDVLPDLPGWQGGLLLPLYASLGGFAAWAREQGVKLDGASLWRYLLEQSEGLALDGLAAQIKRAYRNGRVLLLLDGLDEVADPALRAQVAAAVAALAQPGGYVVVTCRVRSFVDAVAAPLAEWGDPVELAPFTLGQIKHFIRGWYARSVEQGAFEPRQAAARAEQLIERVAALPTLRELGQTPLLLTIITILHYYEGKLPEDRADLYEGMVQLLLTRWTQQRREAGAAPSLLERLKADGKLGGLKDYHIRSVLEELAYRAHQARRSPNGRGLLECGVVRGALLALFRQFDLGAGPANEKTEQVLAYLEEESGLLLHEGSDRYVLPHLTYEEYLAGCYLAKQKGTLDFRTLAYRHWREDGGRWREVILLALGRMVRGDDRDTAASWLQFLLAPAHGERTRDELEREKAALFAAECLADLGGKPALYGVSTLDLVRLWADLTAALAQVVENTTLLAAERVRAGVHLGALGDLRPGVCTLPPAMVRIEGGSFLIGGTPAEAKQALAAHKQAGFDEENVREWTNSEIKDRLVIVATFEIARYPITNAQYALFVEQQGYDPKRPWWDDVGRAWLKRDGRRRPAYWGDQRLGQKRLNHPIVGVTWYEALAFCRWLTKHREYNPEGYIYRLPSEAEWEYAARGELRRAYPWGEDEPDGERANYGGQYGGTTAVGCFYLGRTPEALDDLGGNVWEWTGSLFVPYPYARDYGSEATANPTEKYFTTRGGGWNSQSFCLRASQRNHNAPYAYSGGWGFRLVRHLPV